jgi:hypothetical protein
VLALLYDARIASMMQSLWYTWPQRVMMLACEATNERRANQVVGRVVIRVLGAVVSPTHPEVQADAALLVLLAVQQAQQALDACTGHKTHTHVRTHARTNTHMHHPPHLTAGKASIP